MTFFRYREGMGDAPRMRNEVYPMSTPRKKIFVFLLLTFGLSAVFYGLIIQAGSLASYSFWLMWCPGISAVLTQLIFHWTLPGGRNVGSARYLLVGVALPVIYGLVVYGLVWLSGLGSINLAVFRQQSLAQVPVPIQSPAIYLIAYVAIMATIGLAQSVFAALGEELGWRGLLVPELARETSFTATALISGAIWVVWHAPIVLFADYNNAGAPRWFGLICFTVLVFGIGIVATWLRLKSGSIWPSVLLHASHNIFILHVFNPLTGNTGVTPYVIGEFGIGLALAGVVVGYLFWRRRGEVTLPEAEDRPLPRPAPAGF